MTDQELIEGIIAREKFAVQHLVSNYHKQVIKTAFHFVRNMEDAEDLAQDVCIEVLESVHNFKGSSSLSTWIYRITVNKSLNFIRKNKRSRLIEQVETLFRKPGHDNNPVMTEPSAHDKGIEDKERMTILNEAINRLPGNQKTAFILSRYEELSNSQIAEVMNTTIAGVESLLQRAKKNLQKWLVAQFSEYTLNKTDKKQRN